uniref:Uncharacterized protein n=1 Tax=Physcomitrium patens TaxID=3218 RepID=A0A2K1IF03_PHYPA|nr:hypothetical protein PHYPA_030005 [Physcomitrium patens]
MDERHVPNQIYKKGALELVSSHQGLFKKKEQGWKRREGPQDTANKATKMYICI